MGVRRRVATAVLGSVAALVAHNARVVLTLRARSDDHDHALEHDGRVGDGGGPPLRLAVLGDSSASGFGLADPDDAWPTQVARLLHERTGRPVDVRCVAVRGARMRHVTQRQVPLLGGEHWDVVAVSVGANDALGRRLPFQVRRDTEQMLAAIRDAAPDAALFLGGAGDLGSSPVMPWPLRAVLTGQSLRVAAAQREVAEAAGIPFDVIPRLSTEHFGPDGFHGGASAHRIAAEVTVDRLVAATPWLRGGAPRAGLH